MVTQTGTPAPDQVSIEEAARRLGTSQATIRRRIKRGQLRASKRELPTGYQWYVELAGAEAEATGQPGTQAATHVEVVAQASQREVTRLEEHVGDLRRRVDDQAREIAELHRLLAQQQQLLLMAPRSATQPDSQQPIHLDSQFVGEQAATQPDRHAASQNGEASVAWPEKRRWWQRVLWS
jgi:DNA-binding Lrp family transcriptional regulator